ncbi:MAG: sodium-dependent bicarbonate transport family permease [Gemmataceae bacterium]
MFEEFCHNVIHNMFKPLLLFFYMGFSIPLLRVKFEFPHVLYQAITLYLLVAIGWHGGEELAQVGATEFVQAAGFMLIGFLTNFCIGILAYVILRRLTSLRKIDAATVAGFYGSDSAGTFVTCLGVLTAANIAFAPYMPVMLAVMEIPGCLVALFLVSVLRRQGMDTHGNMPDEPGYSATAEEDHEEVEESTGVTIRRMRHEGEHASGASALALAVKRPGVGKEGGHDHDHGDHHHDETHGNQPRHRPRLINPHVLHEVFLNPGLFLLFGGIIIGFVSRLQGKSVTAPDDSLFVTLFQGILCLFLLEMGITACKRLKDLRTAGWRFVAFGLLVPNLFALIGISVAHLYSHAIGQPLEVGTYALFSVLCAAASYIAVPAVQRLAIPEARPTLPLAASLGLTFSYNVTIGIPLYIMITKLMIEAWPVV